MSTLAAADERDYILGHCDAGARHPGVARRPAIRRRADRRPPGIGDAEPDGSVARFPHLRRIVCVGSAPGPRSVEGWEDVVAAGTSVDDAVLDAAAASVVPSDDALIIYTSAPPPIPRRCCTGSGARWCRAGAGRSSSGSIPPIRVWSPFPFFWTAGLAFVLGGTLACGACFVCQEAFDAGRRSSCSSGSGSPPSTRSPTRPPPWWSTRTPTSGTCRYGGWRGQRCGGWPGSRGIQATRGRVRLTETFTICTSIPSNSPLELRETTHGVTLPGMAIRIVDPDTGEPLGVGETGEIAVRGVTLMRGYYKVAPEDCFDDDGWFRTKDSGHLDEAGYLHWHGRLSG